MTGRMNIVKVISLQLDPLTSKHLDDLVRRQHRTATKIIRQLITAAALGITKEEKTE